MDIIFKDNKLKRLCTDSSYRQQHCGTVRARLLRQRMDDLRAADNLEVMRFLPQTRCHELRGNRDGQISVDLDHPYRLIFEVANDPIPQRPDGGLDWTCVTAIKIIGIKDTHG